MRAPLLLLLITAACTPDVATTDQPVVYGTDDRRDVYDFADQTYAARANEISAAMIDTADISGPANAKQIAAGTLQNSFGVCPDERFATQPTAAGCSATLIAQDLVLTAGHCISDSSCNGTSYVFNWSMTNATTLHTITSDDVYACADVLVDQVAEADFAIVKLDRPVVGRTPAVVRTTATALTVGENLIVQGYPSTIPLKIDDGGAVRDGRAATLDYFVANLDTFGGNSGSGVFLDDGTLVGILVRGEQDYVQDGNCYRVNVCPNDGCGGEESTYAFNAINALCDVAPTPGLCECGDGNCDAGGGETTATCPLDCGTDCGDGACNGDESPLNCTDDCGFCGNAACDNGETEATCCDDCGCSDDTTYCGAAHACIPDPCTNAEVLEPVTQTVNSTTLGGLNDFAGSCVGGAGHDKAYSFTLEGETDLTAHVIGFDTGLYLRSVCATAGSEIACNDDVDQQNGDYTSQIATTLQAGTYFLIVDGFDAGEEGAFELTLTFTPQFVDGCPEDPDKTDPGECGCGVPEGECDETGGGDGGCCSTSGNPAGSLLLGLGVGLAAMLRGRRSRRRR